MKGSEQGRGMSVKIQFGDSILSVKISARFLTISKFCRSQLRVEKCVVFQLRVKCLTNSERSVKPHSDSQSFSIKADAAS